MYSMYIHTFKTGSLLQVVKSWFQICWNKQCEHNLSTAYKQTWFN